MTCPIIALDQVQLPSPVGLFLQNLYPNRFLVENPGKPLRVDQLESEKTQNLVCLRY